MFWIGLAQSWSIEEICFSLWIIDLTGREPLLQSHSVFIMSDQLVRTCTKSMHSTPPPFKLSLKKKIQPPAPDTHTHTQRANTCKGIASAKQIQICFHVFPPPSSAGKLWFVVLMNQLAGFSCNHILGCYLPSLCLCYLQKNLVRKENRKSPGKCRGEIVFACHFSGGDGLG